MERKTGGGMWWVGGWMEGKSLLAGVDAFDKDFLVGTFIPNNVFGGIDGGFHVGAVEVDVVAGEVLWHVCE